MYRKRKCSKKHGKKCHCKKCCCRPLYYKYYVSCRERFFRDKSIKIRSALGSIQYEFKPKCPKYTQQDIRYQAYNYNGSFHKTLQHDTTTGALTAQDQYRQLACSFYNNDLQSLYNVKLAVGSEILLVNPSASFCSILMGAPQNVFDVPTPPTLDSAAAASEMVEVYSQAVARDVAFINYDLDGTIATLLKDTYLNDPDVLANLPDAPAGPFTPQTVFRADFEGCTIGPYISQLLLLDIQFSNAVMEQRYFTYLPRYNQRVEWGVTPAEMIDIENGIYTGTTPPAVDPVAKYIFNGRALAEAVHNDAIFQYYYQAALLMSAAEVDPNPTVPSYLNQEAFVTDNGLPNVICAVAGAAKLALTHAWYWKWVKFRRLRPEVYSLWVHNVKSKTVANEGNYDLNDIILDNDVLNNIKKINKDWLVPTPNECYTLPLCFQEGSPAHGSYPAGHATVAGACATVLKMFFDGNQKWNDVPLVITGALSGGVPGAVQANDTGLTRVAYTGEDESEMTVGGEINKLATNVALGRDWAGVHYRTDGTKGILLGEKVAMRYMGDLLSAAAENYTNNEPPAITFRNFEGELVTVCPTVCSC